MTIELKVTNESGGDLRSHLIALLGLPVVEIPIPHIGDIEGVAELVSSDPKTSPSEQPEPPAAEPKATRGRGRPKGKVEESPKPEPAKEAEPPKVEDDLPPPEPLKEVEPPKPDPKPDAITRKDVRDACTVASDRIGGPDRVYDLLKKYDAKNVNELKEEQFAAFLKEVNDLKAPSATFE